MSAATPPLQTDRTQRNALFAGILLAVIWGAGFSIQKSVYAAMQPGPFLFLRSLLMALCAVCVLRWKGIALRPVLATGERWPFLRAALFGQLLHVLLVTYAIHLSTPFTSAVIMACGPVITLVLLRVLEGTRLRTALVAGVTAAASGVLLFMGDKLSHADLRASGGDLLMLGATVCFSLYTIRVTPLARRYGGLAMMCWGTLLATPVLLLLTLLPVLRAPLSSFPLAAWAAYLWSVLVAAFFAWILWNWVNAVRGVSRTAPLLYLVPPVAGFVGWLFLGEAMTAWKLAGALLAMAGVAMVQHGTPR